MHRLFDSWAGIGVTFVLLAGLFALWAQTTV